MSNTDFERLNIVLSARTREFDRAMNRQIQKIRKLEEQSNKSLSKTSRHFDVLAVAAKRILPALAAGAVVANVKRIVSSMDDIGKTADKLGLTTSALQEYRVAAESAGVGQNTLDMAMQRFGRRVAEARNGTGEARAALAEMGIELVTVDGRARSIEDVLADVADAMAATTEQTDRNRLAMKLFDSEGVAMVNMLRDGSAGLDKMRAAARESGAVIDESLIRKAEAAQTELDAAWRVIDAQLSIALAELIPLLVGGANAFAGFVKATTGAVQTILNILDPSRELRIATDNLVLAMGDEIRQSQLLEQQLGQSIVVSEAAAKQELAEAKARYESVASIIAKRRALALESKEYEFVLQGIKNANEELNSLGFPTLDLAPSAQNVEAFEIAQQRLVDLRNRQQELLHADGDMAEQLARTEKNIADLEQAIASSTDGVVSFNGAPVVPISPGDREETTPGRGASPMLVDPDQLAIEEQAMAESIARIDAMFEGSFGSRLSAAGSYFGNLISLTGSSNDKMLALSKAFTAAQATMDAYGAYNRALNSPTPMDPWTRLAMAGTVLAAGLGTLNAIRGVGSSGSSSGGAATPATPAAAQAVPARELTLVVQGATATSELAAINRELEDGGQFTRVSVVTR